MDAKDLRSLLQRVGVATLQNHVGDIVATLFYGLFVVLFWLSTLMLLQKGFSRRATWATFLVTLTGFLLTTIQWALQIEISTILIRIGSTIDANSTLKSLAEDEVAAVRALDRVEDYIGYILPVISDVVVIWRVWVLYPEHLWVMIGPLVLLLGTLGTTLAGVGFIDSSSQHLDDYATVLLGAAGILSMVTNALSTLLIFYKLWTYRKSIRGGIGILHRRSYALNILVLLVESGLIFLALQIVYLVFNFLPPPNTASALDIVATACVGIYLGVSGIYPTIIVILVHYKTSMEEPYGISALIVNSEVAIKDVEARSATAGHLSFAVQQSTTGSVVTDASWVQAGAAGGEESRVQNHEKDIVDAKAEINRI